MDSQPIPVDGYDMWDTISNGAPSPRTEILLNIDLPEKRPGLLLTYDTWYTGAAIRVGDMKLLMHVPNATWYQVPEEGGIAPDMDEIWVSIRVFFCLFFYYSVPSPSLRSLAVLFGRNAHKSRLRRSFSARFAPIKPPSYAGYREPTSCLAVQIHYPECYFKVFFFF